MTGSLLSSAGPAHGDTAREYYEHSSAPRINTDAVIVEALRREYPQLHLSIVQKLGCDLLAFAAAGHAAVAPIDNEKDRLTWKRYVPTAKRLDGIQDGLTEQVLFGKYLLEWKGREFVLYIVDGRDGSFYSPHVINQYLLAPGSEITDTLLLEAGRFTNELHNEVWVFDRGFWQKSHELWQSVQSSEWEDVILDEGMKKSVIKDVESFFDSRDTYKTLKVPWKRGVIYYGPPGNGKTISIKAMMNSLYKRKDSIPTLYVKTLAGYGGPEFSINQIFGQARRYAPCYLIFEDLDTVITPAVRSYFFNEVDGLKSNDGIFMVGSTNHLDQLDPGIAKRPSRFDRKYLFPDPNEAQRTQYGHFWQGKLKDNKTVDFPDSLCAAFAGITDGFSFAYMQEAFIAALLAIAAQRNHEDDGDDAPVVHVILPCNSGNGAYKPQSPVHKFTIWPIEVDWLSTLRKAVAQYDVKCSTANSGASQWESHRHVEATLTLAAARLIRQLPFVAKVLFALDGKPLEDVTCLADPTLDENVLWRELKRQVKNLREEMDEKNGEIAIIAGGK